ncbi:hypothetical protein BGZ76_010778 [Entomortierella beljakovae]|nr:hypothetical protein BGZ76_010778 [Entomortierella beljakovae]
MKAPLSHILLLLRTIRDSYSDIYSPPPILGLPSKVVPPTAQLALTPPMGYNNWARYECNINQKLFTDTADFMSLHGFLDAGYNTITVDDCWMTMDRNSTTDNLVVNTTLFPDGMEWLGRYFHLLGFKFGIYQDAGVKTCGGYPGSQDHYEIDIAQFAKWEVDYIKLDGCYVHRNESLPESDTLEPTFRQLYGKFGVALRSQPRPMVYSESAPAYFAGLSAGTGDRVGKDWYKVHTWIGQYGHLWRHSTDITVYKDDGKSRWDSVMTNYRFNIRLARFQKPGNWNDPDFIITGDNVGLTLHEQKSQFALWTIMASPLILSTDVLQLTVDQITYLTNREIVAINQDPLGIQGRLAWRSENSDVLIKPLQDTSSRAVAVLNKQDELVNITVSFSSLGYNFPTSTEGCNYTVRDLFTKTDKMYTVLNPRVDSIISELNPHATALYKITSTSAQPSCLSTVPTGSIYLTSSLLCLDIFKSGTDAGTPVIGFPCTSNSNQLWQTSTAPPPFTATTVNTWTDPTAILWIKNIDNLCLDTDFSVATPKVGTRLVVNSCDPERETQQWTYNPMQGSLFHANTGLCADVPGAGNVVGEKPLKMRLWKCIEHADSQVWSMPA